MLVKIKKRLICFLVILIIAFNSGCTPMNLMTVSDSEVDTVINDIVKAFDTKDAELLKSLLNDEVIKSNDNIDNDIKTAFEFYKGKSVDYCRPGEDGGNIYSADGTVKKTAHPEITVTTDCDCYYIDFSYCISDSSNHKNEGVYSIRIMPKLIFNQYYYDYFYKINSGTMSDEDYEAYEKAIEELPDEIMHGQGEDYTQFGLGVFTYDTETIKQLYYEKNGKEMPLADVEGD